MSHVYTESAVRLGHIPDVEDFQVALSLFRKAITELHEKMPQEFPAATVFGGCAVGRQNVCSDIDIIVLVDDRKTAKETISEKVRSTESFGEAKRETRGMFVQAEVYPVVLSNLLDNGTKNDRQFLSHIVKNSRRGLICGNPEAFLSFFKAAPAHTLPRMNAYVGRKAEKLEERLFNYSGLDEEEKARMWLDTYQAPFHAVRRLLDLMDMPDYVDSKKGIVQAFNDIVGEKFVFALLDLKERWDEYVSYIEEAKSHRGEVQAPFVLEDVRKAQLVLRKTQDLAENVCPTRKR